MFNILPFFSSVFPELNFPNYFFLVITLIANEFQKFAYPASEFVLEGLINESDAEVWAPLPRIAECIYNTGINGWSLELIDQFEPLCWRYCILVEEAYGLPECLITLHTLTHVPEDIRRFSSPDNYWCYQYERAVGRYVKQTSNKKGIEKTFARKECQREFVKLWSEKNDVTSQSITGNYDNKKVFPFICVSLNYQNTNLKLNVLYFILDGCNFSRGSAETS
jgi:hypothetical protein